MTIEGKSDDDLILEAAADLKSLAEAAEDPSDKQKYYDLYLKAIGLSRRGKQPRKGTGFSL